MARAQFTANRLSKILCKEGNMNNVKVWKEGETQAKDYLIARGYRVLETNYKNAIGEIDLIAVDPKTRQERVVKNRFERGVIDKRAAERLFAQCVDMLVFVEVKTRSSGKFGDPSLAVDITKQRKVCRAATAYLKRFGKMNTPARFDVISISGDKVEHILNAFDTFYG